MNRASLCVLMCGAALCLAIAPVAFAADPASTCESGKLGTTAKYASCRLAADSKAVKAGVAPDYSKCSLDKFAAAEAKAGAGVCPSEGDQADLQGVLDQCTSRTGKLLHGERFVDNGDGTVTDHLTGLMWEQKTTAVDSGTNPFDPHDVDNEYTLAEVSVDATGTKPTGTAYTEFLGLLNGAADGTCFAGHCDWRLPTREELEGLLDLDAPGCISGSPCIDSTFGSTRPVTHWSGTTDPGYVQGAFTVSFGEGNTDSGNKSFGYPVRAVRSGF